MAHRVVFDIVFFISIFILPWWVTLPIAFLGLFIFNNFYEFIIYNVLLFGMYSYDSDRVIASKILFPIIILSFYFIVQILKHYIILYKK